MQVFLNRMDERNYIKHLEKMIEYMATDITNILSASFKEPYNIESVLSDYSGMADGPTLIESIFIDEGKMTLSDVLDGYCIKADIRETCKVLNELEE